VSPPVTLLSLFPFVDHPVLTRLSFPNIPHSAIIIHHQPVLSSTPIQFSISTHRFTFRSFSIFCDWSHFGFTRILQSRKLREAETRRTLVFSSYRILDVLGLCNGLDERGHAMVQNRERKREREKGER